MVSSTLIAIGRILRLIPEPQANTGLKVTGRVAPSDVTLEVYSQDGSNPDVGLEIKAAGDGGASLARALRVVPETNSDTGVRITGRDAPSRVTLEAFSDDGSNPNVDLEILPAGSTGRVLVEQIPHVGRLLQLVADKTTGSGVSPTNIGFPAAPTTSGSFQNGGMVYGPTITYATAGTTGAVAGLISAAFDYYRRDWNPTMAIRAQTHVGISNLRFWLGFTSADLSAVSTPTTQHVAAFSYDTGRDGTAFWRTVTCDGTTATITATALPVAVSTKYDFRIEIDHVRSEVRFYNGRTLLATHTTNLPGSTTGLGHEVHVTTLANAINVLHWGSIRSWF